MEIKKFSISEFKNVLTSIYPKKEEYFSYLYDCYLLAIDSLETLINANVIKTNVNVNSLFLILYILGEFEYTIERIDKEKIPLALKDEKLQNNISSVAADKYISLSVFNYNESKLSSRYLPPFSSMDLYLNFMLNILNNYHQNDPKNSLIADLLIKSTSIARCILNLINEGYITEALASWRTLHECECTLILLDKYGENVINAYLKHMEYGIAFNGGIHDEIKTNHIFEDIKSQMKQHDLKSKDMKKFIEYGWLYAIPEFTNNLDAKLNFRDGMEPLAELSSYKDVYVKSSELIHCTPLLIYSNKEYFHYLTLLSLYESFFRLEKVFTKLFTPQVNEEALKRYENMKKLYYSQLINIHKIEGNIFATKYSKKEPK